MGFLNYNIIFDIDILNYETDYTKIRHDFLSRGVVHEFSKMAVSLKWILDYFVGYTLLKVRKYQYFRRFELENMSIYEILPALDLTQSVHAKISIGMHRVVKLKISRIPLIGLETRLGWRTDRKFLRNPNLNEIRGHVCWYS